MKRLLVVRPRAALSPLSGFLSCLGLIALPLLSSQIHCGYEDIHHSCLSGFKVFPRGKGTQTSIVKPKNITGIFKNNLQFLPLFFNAAYNKPFNKDSNCVSFYLSIYKQCNTKLQSVSVYFILISVFIRFISGWGIQIVVFYCHLHNV